MQRLSTYSTNNGIETVHSYFSPIQKCAEVVRELRGERPRRVSDSDDHIGKDNIFGQCKKFFQRQFSLWKSSARCTITVQQQPAVSEKKLERNCKKPLLQMSKTSL